MKATNENTDEYISLFLKQLILGVTSFVNCVAISDYNIVSQAGSFYAIYLIESLGVKEDGGVVRIGFTHYNTIDEIEKVVNALKQMAQKA